MILVDRHNGVPIYRQILDQIRFQVASGAFQAGDELPSTRTLAAELGLNPMTVSKAYALLEHEGLVERRPGLSLVVLARKEQEREAGQVEELRRALAPAVVAVRQLGIETERVLEVLAEMIDASKETRES